MEAPISFISGIAVLKPSIRKIDIGNADEFNSLLLSCLSDGARLVLDLSEVDFIDSSGLGKIVGALRSFREKGGDIRICGARTTVKVLFGMVRLGEIAGIDEDASSSAARLAVSAGGIGP